MSVVTMDQLGEKRLDWIVDHIRPAVSVCQCGCGTATRRRFAPGHDASLRRSLEQMAESGNKKAEKALVNAGWKPSTARKVTRRATARKQRVAA